MSISADSVDLRESLRSGLRLLAHVAQVLSASLTADGVTGHVSPLQQCHRKLKEAELAFGEALRVSGAEQAQKLADSMKGYDSQETT